MSTSGLGSPPVYNASVGPGVMLALFGTFALVAFATAVRLSVRDRDPLPVAACVGALICALNEPLFDVLARLVYAHVPVSYVAFRAFGREIPWSLVIGYVPWVGLVPYLLLRQMQARTPRARIKQIAVGLTVSVASLEVINAAWMHSWKYYGQPAWRGVLGGGIIQMAAMPLLCALLYFILGERLTGWRRAVMGLVVPAVTLPMTFAATSWPLYVANYADMPGGFKWAAALVTISLCVAAVVKIAEVAERWHAVAGRDQPDFAARRS